MDILTQISTEIFRAVQDEGAGRRKLEQTFGMNPHEARFYVKLIRQSHPHTPTPEPHKTALILADLHIPYHDARALSVALDYGETQHVDTLIFLGDILDFYQVSFWKTDPARMKFADELETGKAELRKVEQRFPTARKIFVVGNHEYRLTPYLWEHAPELDGLTALSVDELLGLTAHGWEFVDNKQRMEAGHEPFRLGDTYFLHGHEVRCSYGVVNIPRIYYGKVRRQVVVAHHHISQEWNARLLHGQYHRSFAIGCLSNLSPMYNPVNDWNLGFALASYTSLTCQVANHKILDGVVV